MEHELPPVAMRSARTPNGAIVWQIFISNEISVFSFPGGRIGSFSKRSDMRQKISRRGPRKASRLRRCSGQSERPLIGA